MLHHKGCELTVQVSEEDGITITGLVQHRDQVSFSVGSSLGGFDDAHIRNKAVITDGIVIDISCHVLDKTVVTDGNVTQGGMVDARMLHESFRHLHVLLIHTEIHLSVETGILDVVRLEVLCYIDSGPVLCRTSVILKDDNLFFS